MADSSPRSKRTARSSCTRRERKTRFIEIFRTTPTDTVCPNFFVLAHANGCTFRCEYCYLKSSFWYLRSGQVFTNTDRLLQEVRAWIAREDLESYMLNMGNLSDSLGFERVRPLIAALVEVFRSEAEARGRPHSLLLVTKGGTRECRTLFETPPCRNVVVSFSVNAPEAALAYEKGAAPVADRLAAALRLKHLGWRVRMRIDPMIKGFDYSWIADQVRLLAPERVTLGTLRAERSLPRFVGNGLFEDLEPPKDAKGLARYPLRVRLKLYRQAIRSLAGVCPIALCEETPKTWDALRLDTSGKLCNCAL